MQHEIKEVYALAINCIMAAMILTIVMLGIHTRNAFAAAKNDQVYREKAYNQYLTYGVYIGSVLTGDETVSIIREFYSTDGITIYLDKDNDNKSLTVDKLASRQDSSLVSITKLKNRIHPESEYKVWVVYDSMSIDDFLSLTDSEKEDLGNRSNMVTGIVLLRQ